VTWSMSATNGLWANVQHGHEHDKMLGARFDKGLASLKAIAKAARKNRGCRIVSNGL